jgi:hypothetical protein
VPAPDGSVTTVDAPGAGTGFRQGTYGSGGINPAGAFSGYYVDASHVSHGFLRARDGTISTFDVPSSMNATPTGMNPGG